MIFRTLRTLLLLAIIAAPSSVWAQDSTGLTPFIDNVGTPDPNVPIIDNDAIILCIGMSQANWECGGVPDDANPNGWASQSSLPITIVNGAISGWEAERITDPTLSDEYWSAVETRVREAGYTNADVQVMWGKNATRVVENNPDTAAQRLILRDALIEIQAEAERRFPNLRAGFHSPRVYGGHCRANPEPIAHETYQSIVGWDNEAGAIDSSTKWFLGPYIWADGINARGDGLTWLVTDFVMEPVSGPGCHPSQSGIDKVAMHADNFFANLTYATPGSTPPNAPSGLSATAAGATQINLSWTDNSSDETNFRIERATGQGGAFSEITTTAANATSYSDSGLNANTEYCYRVRASSGNGNSAYTAQVCATTNASGGNAPVAPSGLTATASSDMGIDLSWSDNSNDETSFRVERATGQGGAFSEIATTASNDSSHEDRGLTDSTEYCYRVRARNANGDSAYSATDCATTDAPTSTPPPPGPGVQRSGGGSTGLPDIVVLLLFGAGFAARRKVLARARHS